MSDTKPLSADTCECGNDMSHRPPGNRWEIPMAPGREFCSAQCARWAVALDAERALLGQKLDAERARADAAEKSCEDWQECAGHLALALKNAVHPSVYSAEVAMALAEFDRLADESTKGVEL